MVPRLAVESRLTLHVASRAQATSSVCFGRVQVRGTFAKHYAVNVHKLTMLKETRLPEKTVQYNITEN